MVNGSSQIITNNIRSQIRFGGEFLFGFGSLAGPDQNSGTEKATSNILFCLLPTEEASFIALIIDILPHAIDMLKGEGH